MISAALLLLVWEFANTPERF